MASVVTSLPPPNFIGDSDGLDPNLILADMISAFEVAAGRTLQPAQVERLLINLYAYRESLVRNAIQYAGQQNLLAYAVFPMIDYLSQLLGIVRLGAQPAVTIVEFTLANALAVSYTIAARTQVGTSDGQFIFATDEDLSIPADQSGGSVQASCTVSGSAANGYLAGQINVQLNPSALISSVSNTSVSANGAAPESDDHLRARIQAAPNQFSVAGPTGAYRFFALGCDPSIADAQVVSPAPGQVSVYLLIGPNITQPASSPNNSAIASPALLEKALATLSADDVRPLTDTVNVLAVSEIDYEIKGTITIYADADPAATMTAANNAAAAFALALASRIQRDLVPSQIIEALSVSGVYQVALTSPSYVQLQPGQWANCTGIDLTSAVATINS
ncbi:MAG: baseplate assembly protein [Candidatus Binataceae bacterium]